MNDLNRRTPKNAEEIYNEFLIQKKSDKSATIESLCKIHPEHENALKILHSLDGQIEFSHINSFPKSVLRVLADSLQGESNLDSPAHPEKREEQIRKLTTKEKFQNSGERIYKVIGVLGYGGMSVVLEGIDEEINRPVAIKVLLLRSDSLDERCSGTLRFIKEANIASRLEHPGIPSVYDIGVDPEGQPFFTMPLVKGRTLNEVITQAHSESQTPWKDSQLLQTIVTLCRIIDYAHTEGIIHRDLKPANIMVGQFGEIYVMDWGLAKDVNSKLIDPPSTYSSIAKIEDSKESTELTLEGEVLGTPAYLSPEQATGNLDHIDKRSDVYSIGAILYHLLTSSPPYLNEGESSTPKELINSVLKSAPQSILSINPKIPVELSLICNQAMSRSVDARYSSARELGEDLQAFLDNRVVQAYRTGTWAKLSKWMNRNKVVASFALIIVVLLITGSYYISSIKSYSDNRVSWVEDIEGLESIERDFIQARKSYNASDTYDLSRKFTEIKSRLQKHKKSLSDLIKKGTLIDQEQEIVNTYLPAWPIYLEYSGGQKLRKVFLNSRREFSKRLSPLIFKTRLNSLNELVLEEKAKKDFAYKLLTSVDHYEFKSKSDQQAHNLLARLIMSAELMSLEKPILGKGTLIERRIQAVNQSLNADWSPSIQIAKTTLNIKLSPQLGLYPLGPDPESGLLEFAHLESGEKPERNHAGKLIRTPKTAIVFVLLPPRPPKRTKYTPIPFFISKYEMTQANWLYLTGNNPSQLRAKIQHNAETIGLDHPIEGISFIEANSLLRSIGLRLPALNEWMYAAKGRSITKWSTGNSKDSLKGFVNLRDKTAWEENGKTGSIVEEYEEWLEDGHSIHSPVGSYKPNPFGLHDIHGNVWEFTRGLTKEQFEDIKNIKLEENSGLGFMSQRKVFGGSFLDLAENCSSESFRYVGTGNKSFSVGIRALRKLEIGKKTSESSNEEP